MDELYVLRPWWLVGAALCMVLGMISHRRRTGRSEWHEVIDPKLAKALIRQHAGRYAFGSTEVLWVMLVLGMLALSGPSWDKQLPDGLKDQAAVIVLLGNSESMYAGDIVPNRNRAAKDKIKALRRVMPQSSFSVIAYASTAHLVIPLTRDDSFFELFLQPLEPDVMPKAASERSGLGQALDLAQQSAGTAGMPVSVILMTDSLAARERSDLRQFHQKFPAVEVLVVGTEEGGTLRFAPANLDAGDTRVPLGDFAALKGEGVPVISITTDDQDVAWLAQNIRGTIAQAQNADARWHWQDSGHWIVIAMLPLGLLLYRHVSLLSVAAPLVLLLASAYTPDARADWQSLWWTPDQLGQQAMDKGDYPRAAELFADSYRKGRAYYLAKHFSLAAEAFREVKTAEGYFYLGNSLAQQQRYQAALKYYRQALLIRPDFPEASRNADSVKALLDELAKQPSQREKTDAERGEITSIKVDLNAPRNSQDETPVASSMSDDELKNWMTNVKTSPKDMLKALFLLQSQERRQQEGP